MPTLSPSKSVDVGLLAGLFTKTTNSYKYLFFQSLLSLIQDRSLNETIITFEKLAVEMLALAWYPHNYFSISFGLQDQVGKSLNRLQFDTQGASIGRKRNQTSLRRSINVQADQIGLDELLRYVPYRLLYPFFQTSLRGIADTKRNQRICHFAKEYFSEIKPLYKFILDKDCLCIDVHPDWMEYLKTNWTIVNGWAERQWIEYLQARNPTVPALSKKIRAPAKRSTLQTQKRFWDQVLSISPIRYIYSGEALHHKKYALDHFLPWAYVCHDQLWNLVPVSSRANSQKGHALPSEKYLTELANIHAYGLKVYRENATTKENVNKTIEPYLSDLHLSEDNLKEPNMIREAYFDVVLPQMTLARQAGFSSNWVYTDLSQN